jgi:hypothetical protein
MTTKTVSIPVYHELRDGAFVRLSKILADPELQAQLVNKRRFKCYSQAEARRRPCGAMMLAANTASTNHLTHRGLGGSRRGPSGFMASSS